MKLGTLLLRDGVINLGQLEAALRAQVLYGGRLGTNLVELSYLDLDTLGPYLSEILDVPLATQEHFEAADNALIEWFGADLADHYTAFPLGYEPDQEEDVLAVAFDNPRNEPAIAELATQCGKPIIPYVAPELRIFYYLEKHYGLKRKARYVRSGTRRAAPGHADERRRTQAPGGIEMPPAVRFEPKKKKPQTTQPEVAASSSEQRPEQRVTYKEACELIEDSEHRDEIGHALVQYAEGRFETCVVFLLRDANALGWYGYSVMSDDAQSATERLGLPLGGASVLQASHDSGQPFRGQSPSAGRPIEMRLWSALGVKREPDEVLVIPVRVGRRVVNLIYVHGFDGEQLPDYLADELEELALRAADAYVRLIQIAKSGARSDTDADR